MTTLEDVWCSFWNMTLSEGLHFGECLTMMRQIADNTIDMVICDLPYSLTSNRWDSLIPLDALWDTYNRICKPTAAIVLTAGQPFTSILVTSNLPMFRHEWIWLKNRGSNFANTVREPMKEHESVLVFSKGKWTYNKQMQERTGTGSDRVKYGVAFQSQSANYREFAGRDHQMLPEMRVPSSWQKFNCEVGLHPTQKPVGLFEYLIKTYSHEDDLVLDNCAGSGTTAIACLNLHRRYLCIEQDPDYFTLASKRIDKQLDDIDPFRTFR